MEPMQILSRSSILHVLRRPKVAPVRRFSPHRGPLVSAPPRWWPPALARRDAPPMAAPNPLLPHFSRVLSYGSRTMASSSGAEGEVVGKPDKRLLIPSSKDIVVPPGEHFAIPSAKDVMVPPDEDWFTKFIARDGGGPPASGEDERRARLDIVSDNEVASLITIKESNGDVFPLDILPDSSHRDDSIYRDTDPWKTEYCIADRNETRFGAMALSVPTTKCYIEDGICGLHSPHSMLQIFSLKVAKIPVDGGSVELYGYIAIRDEVDPLLNYVVKISRDDPIVVEQGSLINMVGPKRGIELCGEIIIEYDMRIKTGGHEKDDLQLIDGASAIADMPGWRYAFTNRIYGDCGAIDITASQLECAVEATVEVFISEVQSSFSLCLGCFTSGLHEEARLFDGIIGYSCGLKRSVIAVMVHTSLDLKFKVGSGSHGCIEHCCSFKPKSHGCAGEQIKTEVASLSVKVTWSAVPLELSGLNLA